VHRKEDLEKAKGVQNKSISTSLAKLNLIAKVTEAMKLCEENDLANACRLPNRKLESEIGPDWWLGIIQDTRDGLVQVQTSLSHILRGAGMKNYKEMKVILQNSESLGTRLRVAERQWRNEIEFGDAEYQVFLKKIEAALKTVVKNLSLTISTFENEMEEVVRLATVLNTRIHGRAVFEEKKEIQLKILARQSQILREELPDESVDLKIIINNLITAAEERYKISMDFLGIVGKMILPFPVLQNTSFQQIGGVSGK